MWGGALDSYDVLLSYHITSLAYHTTNHHTDIYLLLNIYIYLYLQFDKLRTHLYFCPKRPVCCEPGAKECNKLFFKWFYSEVSSGDPGGRGYDGRTPGKVDGNVDDMMVLFNQDGSNGDSNGNSRNSNAGTLELEDAENRIDRKSGSLVDEYDIDGNLIEHHDGYGNNGGYENEGYDNEEYNTRANTAANGEQRIVLKTDGKGLRSKVPDMLKRGDTSQVRLIVIFYILGLGCIFSILSLYCFKCGVVHLKALVVYYFHTIKLAQHITTILISTLKHEHKNSNSSLDLDNNPKQPPPPLQAMVLAVKPLCQRVHLSILMMGACTLIQVCECSDARRTYATKQF